MLKEYYLLSFINSSYVDKFSERLDAAEFFFSCVQSLAVGPMHETHKPLFSIKLSLKIDLTTLFTHLKIILVQCFQFLVISGIQTELLEVQKNKKFKILCQNPGASYLFSCVMSVT